MAIKIQNTLLEKLQQHAEETYPDECCGVLIGRFDNANHKAVSDVVKCANACTETPQSRFQISPSDLIRIQREARLGGHDIVGFYHSHPDHPATWSSTDLAEAHWTGCSYVITSVENGKAVLTASFILSNDKGARCFVNEAIEPLNGLVEESPLAHPMQ